MFEDSGEKPKSSINWKRDDLKKGKTSRDSLLTVPLWAVPCHTEGYGSSRKLQSDWAEESGTDQSSRLPIQLEIEGRDSKRKDTGKGESPDEHTHSSQITGWFRNCSQHKMRLQGAHWRTSAERLKKAKQQPQQLSSAGKTEFRIQILPS